MHKVLKLFIIFLFIYCNVTGQNIKVKSDDIKDLMIEINNLKIENQKLSNEVLHLKESLSQIENNLKINYNQHTQSIEKLQKSILFLSQDLKDFLKGDSKVNVDKLNRDNINPVDKNSDFKKEPKSEYSGQCNATTKKGARCSRVAKSNGFCWQHGG
jgi:FtsZ-binding cell division protein ZapB